MTSLGLKPFCRLLMMVILLNRSCNKWEIVVRNFLEYEEEDGDTEIALLRNDYIIKLKIYRE